MGHPLGSLYHPFCGETLGDDAANLHAACVALDAELATARDDARLLRLDDKLVFLEGAENLVEKGGGDRRLVDVKVVRRAEKIVCRRRRFRGDAVENAAAKGVAVGGFVNVMMLPVQWITSPLTRDALQTIAVAESLPAPPMCVVRRAGLPLTPAAEYFCDVIRRAAARVGKAEPPRASAGASAKKAVKR